MFAFLRNYKNTNIIFLILYKRLEITSELLYIVQQTFEIKNKKFIIKSLIINETVLNWIIMFDKDETVVQ